MSNSFSFPAGVRACFIALFFAIACVAFAEPSPGKAGELIAVDVSTEAASVQLPGVEARLVAVVAPGGVFTLQGPAFATNAITGLSATLISDYYAESHGANSFAVSVELRRQAGYTDLVALDAFGSPKTGKQIARGRAARTAGEEYDSATTYFALLELSLVASPQSGKFDLATTVVYGPPFDEALDIPLTGSSKPLSFMGTKITPTVIRLPETDPESEVPAGKRPAVSLLFAPNKAFPAFEVQAVREDGTALRSYDRPDLSSAPTNGKAQWVFGKPDPISKASIAKFSFRGYRLQPIVWKNIALPGGIAVGK
ncbi:MAG: hypothetical protein IT366_08295 [Candidatus Hydrogenedentes bacterium]|nr:hypothetical protein [Candidatus Hydrogenedentota bacterium]